MGDKMIPKQIRLTQKQNILLKRLAKERGVSESEVLRQVLEHEFQREPGSDKGKVLIRSDFDEPLPEFSS